jgi:hypothetical protein
MYRHFIIIEVVLQYKRAVIEITPCSIYYPMKNRSYTDKIYSKKFIQYF